MIGFRSNIEDNNIVPEISLASYLRDLYTDPNLALQPIRRTATDEEDEITEGELNIARHKLSHNKAIGVDLLPDKFFHNNVLWMNMKTKILRTFNEWTTTLRIPSYVKKAKIIPLSKDANNSPFPILGEVRTIAVTPAISKLYELCIL